MVAIPGTGALIVPDGQHPTTKHLIQNRQVANYVTNANQKKETEPVESKNKPRRRGNNERKK